MRQIDLACIECVKCGHRSTAPEAINSYGHQMEIYAVEEIKREEKEQLVDGKLTKIIVEVDSTLEDQQKKQQIEGEHPGNVITARKEGDKKVWRFARSYCKAEFDKTSLEESDNIILKCPQCDQELYRAKWVTAEQRKQKIEEEKKRALAEAIRLIKAQGGDISETEALRKAGLKKVVVGGEVRIVGL